MKYVFLLFSLLFPINAYAEIVAFKSFSIDIPENYEYEENKDTISIYSSDFSVEHDDEVLKANMLIKSISNMNYTLEEYVFALAIEFEGNTVLNLDKESYSFEFESFETGPAKAFVIEGLKEYLFIFLIGENKEELENILNTLTFK